jgi:hypothetical protein
VRCNERGIHCPSSGGFLSTAGEKHIAPRLIQRKDYQQILYLHVRTRATATLTQRTCHPRTEKRAVQVCMPAWIGNTKTKREPFTTRTMRRRGSKVWPKESFETNRQVRTISDTGSMGLTDHHRNGVSAFAFGKFNRLGT